MVTLNAHGEVADFLDTSQFLPGRSAYECVAYAASLIKYAGLPGKGPIGTALQASNLAQYWYGREEGSNVASNKNGMSLDALYAMLQGMGLRYQPEALQDHGYNLALIKLALSEGTPLIVCGAETGMHDLALGDAVPYGWTPTGNHAIVVSGMTPDGNLLVHDTASIDSNGVRPGPRHYDASKMQIVSVTAVHLTQEDDMAITINSPGVGNYFVEVAADRWHCPSKKVDMAYAFLSHYKATNGLQTMRLPISGEIPIEDIAGGQFAQYAGHGITVMYFEVGPYVYDKDHLVDNPPGAGDVYPLKVYEQGAGTDPRLFVLQKQLQAAQTGVGTADPRIADYQGRLKQINTLSVV